MITHFSEICYYNFAHLYVKTNHFFGVILYVLLKVYKIIFSILCILKSRYFYTFFLLFYRREPLPEQEFSCMTDQLVPPRWL